MGSFPFQLSGAATAAALAGQSIPGALTVTGLLSLTGGITTNSTYGGSSLAGVSVPGNIRVNLAGDGLLVNEGANGKQGTATLAAGTVTVSNTNVTANSRIFLSTQTPGGAPGWLQVSARTAGTSFTILSSSGTDTSVVAFEIFEPG
jgi:hypothetical protein